jgi:E3 ubiquitin-protein ligase RLIM
MNHLTKQVQKYNYQKVGFNDVENVKVITCDNNFLEHTCSICQCSYESTDKIRILSCQHNFHQFCVDKWLDENTTCPICRKHLYN